MSNAERRLNVGIDLNGEHPQICYYEQATDNTVTAPLKIGNETASFRDILEELDEMDYDDDTPFSERETRTEELGLKTAEILKKALATLGTDTGNQITGLTITVPHLTRPIVSAIRIVFRELDLGDGKGFLQDYDESFYYYTLYQKEELWNRSVGFFDFDGKRITFTSLSLNRQTRPVSVTCEEGVTITLRGEADSWDEQFSNMIQASLRQNIYTSVFLQGETFDRSWAVKSTSLLLRGGRKAFIVDNLYARGACCAAREKTLKKRLQDYLYIGRDMVRTNLGMQMIIQGQETYYPLVTAGVSWYEVDKKCECILEGEPVLTFQVSAMGSSAASLVRMELTDLDQSKRPVGTTRIGLHVTYEAPGRCVIEAEDLGFGDLYPSGGQVWKEVLEG